MDDMRVAVVAYVLILACCGDSASPAGECSACTGADTCQDGACLPPRSCTATTCPRGCCDDNDACQPGTALDACGDGGGRCATCANGNCTAGICIVGCDRFTCAGCCSADGACVTATAPSTCGKNGEACAACESGQSCVAGTCSDASCLTTCLGCCTGTACTTASQSDSAHCGDTGEVCATCGPGAICTNGACVPGAQTRWDLVLLSGDVTDVAPDGTAWDAFDGLPDPVLCARAPAGEERCSPSAENTTTPVWTAPLIANATPDEILGFDTWAMYDDDTTTFDDAMGSCVNHQTDYAMFDGDVRTFVCGAGSWTVRYQLVQRL